MGKIAALCSEKFGKQGVKRSTLHQYLCGGKQTPLPWPAVRSMIHVCRDLVRQAHGPANSEPLPPDDGLPTAEDLGEIAAWYRLWQATKEADAGFSVRDSPINLAAFGLPVDDPTQKSIAKGNRTALDTIPATTAEKIPDNIYERLAEYLHDVVLHESGGDEPDTVKVTRWHAQPGQIIRRGQEIITVDYNDATEFPRHSEWDGILIEICVPEGEIAPTFCTLYRILEAWGEKRR